MMLGLTGNRVIQKREVEKRMNLHWKNLEEKKSTGASWRQEPLQKSMLNDNQRKAKQKVIHQRNEKLISKLYEILTSKNRPYSPQKNKSSELYERARKIQLDGQRIKKNEINKRIGEKNLQLLEAITTVKSSHNPVDLEKDYIERKRIVERLRLNSSPTALHLLAAPPVLSKRPKSAPKERPKSGDSLPSWFIKGGDKGRIYPSSAFSSTGASAYPTFPSSIKPKSLMGNESPNVESSPSPSPAPEEISQKLFQVPSADEQRQITQEGVGEVTTDEISRPRKVLLSEIDMRGVVVTPSLSSPKAENSNYMKMKRNQNSVPFPHSAVFIVRIYDVGRTIVPISSPHTKNEANSKCYSSGLVVESKMLPETEKSMAYELFLPLKQLKLLVDNQPSSIYDSLGRKLRRLKCINRETGLYTDLSNNLPPAFLEQLCDLVLRNIETVIEPKEDVSAPTDSSEMLDRCEDEDGENIRKNYSVRIQLKSRDQ